MILAGHSHLCALVGSHYAGVPAINDHPEHKGVSVLGGDWPRSSAYWDRLVANAHNSRLAIIWGGNEHNSLYFFERAFKFDFKSNYISRLMMSSQIISQSSIKSRFRAFGVKDLEGLLLRIAAKGPDKIVLVGTPPPKKDNQRLQELLPQEPHFVEWAKQIGGVEQVTITDPFVRLKLWHVLQDMIAEAAARVGACFVPVPQELKDDEGFLKPEYWAWDVTHANEAYGEIMLRRVVEELGS